MSSEFDQRPDFGTKSAPDKIWDQFKSRGKDLCGLAAETAACVRFFSRLPLPKINRADDLTAPPDFTRISRAAPFAGFVIALPAAALGVFLGFTELPALAVATIIAGFLAATTGALHEDGLGDVADGFFGGATRERRLEIMKDSRIGAFGALTLIITVALRISLLAALWQRFSPADAALLFLGGEALSRALLVWQWQLHPLARPNGLAAKFGKPTTKAVQQSLVFTIPLLIPAALLLSLPALSLALLLAAGTAYATGRLALIKVGGLTGDVLGAMQQLSGLGFLIGLLMVP